ncbi:MAG: hypothetical protein OEZ48_16220 [Candidatus Bathyarchaeota archaeon]|nr:hypothetical protein [Candidatus Bathyarchaeota archaeon]
MKLNVLHDNEAREGFRGGWGFSCLVGDRLLFYTGADVSTLLFNMSGSDIRLEKIGKIVLSHEHRDHVGGIQILGELQKVEVYVPKSFSSESKKRLTSHPSVNLAETEGVKESLTVFSRPESWDTQ